MQWSVIQEAPTSMGGGQFTDLETANKYLSGYVFLLKDRFVKSIGISGGKII